MRGKARLALNEIDKALEDFDAGIRRYPGSVTSYVGRAMAWSANKQFAKAVKDFDEAIHLTPAFSLPYRDYAWLLATCPQEEFRNGDRALLLARIASELAQWKGGFELNALAAAYAETGQFDEAERYQRKALEDPDCASEKAEFLKRLELYTQRKPFRQGN